jgi:UDP-2-acetamido-3-amino-2,3-dideoxy-glucuronate N-acetyltransferase
MNGGEGRRMTEKGPRVAVVGCGHWGKNLVRNFYELGNLDAVFDVDELRLLEVTRSYPVPCARSFNELLSNPAIQGLVIATPAAQHFELARNALLAGKDVLVEKPLALRVREGEALVELAREKQRILMVGHLLQYHPATPVMKRLIRNGDLGRIQYIHSSRLNLGKLRTEENILWSFAPHDISVILFLLDEEPTLVAAHGGNYLNHNVADVTLTTMDFASGVKAHIFVSWLHPFKEQKLVVVADRKMLVFDDTEKERKLLVYPHRIDWIDRIPVAHKVEAEVVALPAEEPLRLECQHFLECIQDRKKCRTDGESALRVLKILEACERSLESRGQPIPLELREKPYFVHPTAVVDEPCVIGEGTRVWHFSHVMAKSLIGKGCNLGQNVHVATQVRVGNNVKIQNNVSIYTGVELEDDVFCGPSMVFTNVINPRSRVDRKNEFQRTLVKRGASLGANSTILCGTTIGRFAFVAAGAVVTRDVPDYALVMGVPARQVGWICRCGVRLELNGHMATCHSCGDTYVLDQRSLLPQPAGVSGVPASS